VRAAVDVLEERDEEEGGVTAREREGGRGGRASGRGRVESAVVAV